MAGPPSLRTLALLLEIVLLPTLDAARHSTCHQVCPVELTLQYHHDANTACRMPNTEPSPLLLLRIGSQRRVGARCDSGQPNLRA